MTFEKLPITVLIMCQNEELNIAHTLDSVINYFEQVIVTDSFSIDKTSEIVQSFSNVEYYENKFIGWAQQRNWMLDNCQIRNEVVFFLDADEVVNQKFIKELSLLLNQNFDAIEMKADMYFLGKHIKYAYGHPYAKRIFKKSLVRFSAAGAREYSNVRKNILRLKNRLHHEDRRGLSFWIDKHNRNSSREALVHLDKQLNLDTSNISFSSRIKLMIRVHIWDKLPLALRPFGYFIFRYIFQGGFIDGRIGFLFCFFHALWYPMLIDAKILESKHVH